MPCEHKWECGCGKKNCLEMNGEECDDIMCDNEECRHYYDHRNDNCDCMDTNCSYCKDSDNEIIYSKEQDDFIKENYGEDYDWSIEEEEWSEQKIIVRFSDGETEINEIWIGKINVIKKKN